jgi:hypothetical protein
MIDGFVIQVIDDASIETLFPQFGLRIKFKALVNAIKKSLAEQYDSNIIENINTQYQVQHSNVLSSSSPTQSTTPVQEASNSLVQITNSQNISHKKFPVPFEFPEHRLDKILKANLQNVNYVPKESDIKSIIDCVFKEMLEYLYEFNF